MFILFAWVASASTLYLHQSAQHGCGVADPTGQVDAGQAIGCMFREVRAGDTLVFGVPDQDEPDGIAPGVYLTSWLNNERTRAPHGVAYDGQGSTLKMPDSVHWTKRRQDKVMWVGGPPDDYNNEALVTSVSDFVFDGNRCGQQGWLPRWEEDVCGDGWAPACLSDADCGGNGVCYGEDSALDIEGICYTETHSANLHISGQVGEGHPTPRVQVNDVTSHSNTLAGIYAHGYDVETSIDNATTHDVIHGVIANRAVGALTLDISGHTSFRDQQSIHIESQTPHDHICDDLLDDDETTTVRILGGEVGHISWGVPDGRGSTLKVADVEATSLHLQVCHAEIAVDHSSFSGDVDIVRVAESVHFDNVEIDGQVTASAWEDGQLSWSDVRATTLNWCTGGGCNSTVGPASLIFDGVQVDTVRAHLYDTQLTDVAGSYGYFDVLVIRYPVSFTETVFTKPLTLGNFQRLTEVGFYGTQFLGRAVQGGHAMSVKSLHDVAPPYLVFEDVTLGPAPSKLAYLGSYTEGTLVLDHATASNAWPRPLAYLPSGRQLLTVNYDAWGGCPVKRQWTGAVVIEADDFCIP
jgi:hypothetical protein